MKLIKRMPVIKVITGVRCAGKSKLLDEFILMNIIN